MKPTLTFVLLLVFATAALAAPKKGSSSVALELGTVLAAEEFCGLSYDTDKVTSFIEENVAADDMRFASTLQLMTAGKQSEHKDMTATAKAAHCAQIRRVAKANGFIH
ncbi:signal recognition particle [Agrobacterium tumefaciens]|uniref:signal recognition particle n=1 Tax=Agrobacterium tumefaciens TaxID=358 RepID=UPI002244CD99|nr:signal recognition particle [Agrobacterium tumefaciens]MCW8059312.1 signal recognition particle [Agrobacterium tumefaciens]MCW8147114.1 signal recognition particle [Agrobacterium tumefaciens]